MLFNSLVRPGVEIQQAIVRSASPFELDRLRKAWRWAVARHPALRTALDWTSRAEPTQRVLPPPSDLEIAVHELGSAFEPALEEFLARDRVAERRLDRPVLSLALLRGEGGCAMVWTHHHAQCDGRAVEIVLTDVLRRYDEGAAYEPAPPATMREHVAALGTRAQGPALAHFREMLAGFTEPTAVPGAGARPLAPGEPPHREFEHQVPPSTVGAIERAGGEHGFTLNAALQAAWAIVLGRYAYADDVVFGVTRACRHVVPRGPEIAGCLINTVPVRARVAGDRTLLDLVRALRAESLAVRPFETEALTRIKAASDLAGARRIFDTVVVYEGRSLDDLMRAQGGPFASRRFELRGRSDAPLTLAAYRTAAGALRLVIEIQRGEVDDEVASSLGARVERVLAALAADPETTLAQIDLTSEAERRPIVGADRGASGVPAFERASDAILASVAKYGARPALIEASDGTEWSFSELAREASALARRLRDAGLEPGDVVAVIAPRRASTVIATLAAQLAGLVYVPLDPAYPAERTWFLLGDSGARALLIPEGHTPPPTALPVIENLLGARDASASSLAPPVAMPASAPAYVIYTSGSTGTPKGVVVPISALAAHARAAVHAYGLTSNDRVLQFASPSFDVSLEEIVPTLVAGAAVVVRSDAMAGSMERLHEGVRAYAISVLQLPTAFFNELAVFLERTGASLPPSVHTVVIGGERASATACRAFRRCAPSVRLVNAYGPTEVTITSTWYDVPNDPDRVPDEVPIGRPFGRCTAYVLDRAGRPAPPRAKGELVLGGPQVASGYHGRAELTAARFTPDPVDPARGTVYRTGDVVRLDASGALVFLGRGDEQVKIRGFRIELGEVEAALVADPQVAEAAVLVVRDSSAEEGGGDDALAAVVVAASGELDTHALRERLRSRMPRWLVPARIAQVASLPKTAGGKVDRRALASISFSSDEAAPAPRAAEPPEDELEDVLLHLFREVLGNPSIGVEDDFFERGGHSIRAVRLAGRIEETLGAKIGIAAVFERPTVRALARSLRSATRADADGTLVRLNRASDGLEPLFCVAGLRIYEELASAFSRRPVFGVYVPEEESSFGEGRLVPTEQLAAAYIRAVRAHQGRPPKLIAGFSYGGIVAIEMAQQLRAAGEPADLVVLIDPLLPSMLERRVSDVAVNLFHRLLHQPTEVPARLARRVWRLLLTEEEAAQIEPADDEMWMRREGAYAQSLASYEQRIQRYEGRAMLFVTRDRQPAAVPRIVSRWREILGANLEDHVLPGDHGNILGRPHVDAIAEKLTSTLSRRPSMTMRRVRGDES